MKPTKKTKTNYLVVYLDHDYKSILTKLEYAHGHLAAYNKRVTNLQNCKSVIIIDVNKDLIENWMWGSSSFFSREY
jgi:hypothetical protein